MLDQRIQLLVSKEQRRRLEARAKESGKSVGQLIRDAIDERYGRVTLEERIRAAHEITHARGGRDLTVEQMNELIGEERLANFPEALRRRQKKA